MYDIIIIGAGTAGMSAAIYGIRAGKSVLVIEEKSYGGQIVNASSVENYPGIKSISGFQFATEMYNQLTELEGKVVFEKVKKIEDGAIKKVKTLFNEYECKTIIIATGARNRTLNLDNEKRLIGQGVSYCATCDGMFFKNKKVAVVGGGNTALEDATFLSQYCNKVYIIHRREEFRGEELQVEHLTNKGNVELILSSNVVELIGEEHLKKITVENKINGKQQTIDVDGIFIAIGQAPDNGIFSEIVDIDNKGYIVAGEECTTSTKGIFAAGDCRTKKVRQLTTAASDGAVAALAACEYMDR